MCVCEDKSMTTIIESDSLHLMKRRILGIHDENFGTTKFLKLRNR